MAILALVKCISSVLARSNSIAFSLPSLYSLSTSLSRTLIFLKRLVEEVVRAISSIYDKTEQEGAILGNKSLIYIRKRIGEIGLP